MAYLSKTMNISDYSLSHKQELLEITAYTVLLFFLPFIAGHSQFIVGSIVNSLLILSALNIKGYRLLPIIFAPSLGALSAGLLFGSLTVFLVYMVPFIWIGNAILIYIFKALNLGQKINKWAVLLTGSAAKSLLLFTIAYLFVSNGVLPVIFLTTMGLF